MKTIISVLTLCLLAGLLPASAETVVYHEIPLTYPWSGLMGSDGGTDSLPVAPFSDEDPHSGDICARATYDSSAEAWAGVFVQATGDWRRGSGIGLDLTGSQTLSFAARGGRGGEVVTFGYGYEPDRNGVADSASDDMKVTLTDGWREFAIDLGGRDLSSISGLFSLRLDGGDNPEGATIYVDDIRYT
jgi:hypothetical protein